MESTKKTKYSFNDEHSTWRAIFRQLVAVVLVCFAPFSMGFGLAYSSSGSHKYTLSILWIKAFWQYHIQKSDFCEMNRHVSRFFIYESELKLNTNILDGHPERGGGYSYMVGWCGCATHKTSSFLGFSDHFCVSMHVSRFFAFSPRLFVLKFHMYHGCLCLMILLSFFTIKCPYSWSV